MHQILAWSVTVVFLHGVGLETLRRAVLYFYLGICAKPGCVILFLSPPWWCLLVFCCGCTGIVLVYRWISFVDSRYHYGIARYGRHWMDIGIFLEDVICNARGFVEMQIYFMKCLAKILIWMYACSNSKVVLVWHGFILKIWNFFFVNIMQSVKWHLKFMGVVVWKQDLNLLCPAYAFGQCKSQSIEVHLWSLGSSYSLKCVVVWLRLGEF